MSYWPWYLGGAVLAAVALMHWIFLGRTMAVSGRFTAIVNRLRYGEVDEIAEGEPSRDELIASIRGATEALFGPAALADPSPQGPEPVSAWSHAPRPPLSSHLVFFASLLMGGLLSALGAGIFKPTLILRGEAFSRLVHGSPLVGAGLLLLGGVLIGFGTRMAGGCTTGHGLCGVSRFHRGSLLATAAFFGAGVATSLLLGRLR